jgi:hypothetical protein
MDNGIISLRAFERGRECGPSRLPDAAKDSRPPYSSKESCNREISLKFKTLAIHAGHSPVDHIGAVMTPIYQTSTFAFRGVNRPGAFDYSRSGNPTRKALETCLASLEVGSSGFAFATGMAAETTVLMMFDSGDRIVVHSDLYGGTYRLFQSVLRGKGIEAVYVDLRDAAATERVLAGGAAAVWIESPTNPLMKLVEFNCPAAKTAATRLDRGALRIRAASDRIPTNPRRRLRCRGIPRRRDSE